MIYFHSHMSNHESVMRKRKKGEEEKATTAAADAEWWMFLLVVETSFIRRRLLLIKCRLLEFTIDWFSQLKSAKWKFTKTMKMKRWWWGNVKSLNISNGYFWVIYIGYFSKGEKHSLRIRTKMKSWEAAWETWLSVNDGKPSLNSKLSSKKSISSAKMWKGRKLKIISNTKKN